MLSVENEYNFCIYYQEIYKRFNTCRIKNRIKNINNALYNASPMS